MSERKARRATTATAQPNYSSRPMNFPVTRVDSSDSLLVRLAAVHSQVSDLSSTAVMETFAGVLSEVENTVPSCDNWA